jgi:hypothetical protein
MTAKSETPKEDRNIASERICNLFNHGLSDAEIANQTLYDIDNLTLIGIIRDLSSNNSTP